MEFVCCKLAAFVGTNLSVTFLMTSVPWLCSLLRVLLELFLPWVSSCDRVYYTSLSTFPSLYLFYYNADILVAMVTNCNGTFFMRAGRGFLRCLDYAVSARRVVGLICGKKPVKVPETCSVMQQRTGNEASERYVSRPQPSGGELATLATGRGRLGHFFQHCGLQWGHREPFLVMQLQEALPSYLMCVMLPGFADAFQLSVQ